MKLFEILRPKKIALYTALILGSSFVVVGCDNSKAPVSVEKAAEKPAEMSQQQLSDFIKNSVTNFITKYNQVQSFAAISLQSFTPSADNQQITIVLRTELVNLDGDDDEQPIIIDLTYLITPEQSLQNNAYAVAKFVAQKISLVSDSSTLDPDSFPAFVKQFINDAGLAENGYVMASGDILSDIVSKNGFDYVNDNAYDDLSAFNLAPSNYHFQTKDSMKLIDVNYSLSSLSFQFDDINVFVKNINTQQLDHSFDNNFGFTGQNLYKIDSINIKNDDKDIALKDIIINTKSDINDKGFASQYVTSSLSGNFPNAIGDKINFSASGNLKAENLNLEAYKKWNQHINSPSFEYGSIYTEKLQLLSLLIKDGFSFAITDTNIELDGAKGNFDISFDIAPTNISSTTKQNAAAMQIFNNVTIQVNSVIPKKWFNSLGTGMSQDNLDKTIKQMVQQIDAMGYDGALTYDGEKLTAHFDIKKGNVFVNGELKGSLINTLAAFM
ncbi:DUF945 family protein [Orbus wheelerorum]|uniref:hypothetical protein n=1 Tax=Orbus wheelerorum TaxID=3074111 RepID=UPI00370D14C8